MPEKIKQTFTTSEMDGAKSYDDASPREGLKFDQGKDPWDLAPWDSFRAVVKVLALGAKKYAPRNWEDGMAWSRLYASTMRHLTAWWEGEDNDPEMGHSHLWNAGTCIMFLIAYEISGVGKDDRPGR